MSPENLPPALQDIIAEFEASDRQEKIELLLYYAEQMPPLPDWLVSDHKRMDQVHECMTPVFIHAEPYDSGMRFYFDIPKESPTVRGFAGILAAGLDGVPAEVILALPNDFFQPMGLDSVLSSQRMNGISAIFAYLKRLAAKHLEP